MGLVDVDQVDQMLNTNYKLHTKNPDAVRKQLMQLSLKYNWNIVSLQSGSNSLEDIFRSFTLGQITH